MSLPTPYYQSDKATLYCGDCLEILPHLSGVDAVVTDPPYGVGYITNHRNVMATPGALYGDSAPDTRAIAGIYAALQFGGAAYIATRFDVMNVWREAMAEAGFILKTPIVWDKGNWTAGDLDGDFGCQVEILLFAHKGRHILRNGRPSNLWRFARDQASEHPTPKPVALMAMAIECSSESAQTILDPFMGSGTTGVAAVKLGRRFIGIEIEPKYCEIAKRRIIEAEQSFALFDPPKPARQMELQEAAR